jgi:NADPH:quinone reductase-like Zn-dependent oxidoreductase
MQVHTASLNPVDFKIAKGILKSIFPYSFPLVLGWDAVGVIDSIGEGVTRVKPGDAVWAYCRKSEVIRDGTLAEYIVVPEDYVAAPPKSLSSEEAATIPLAGLTAWQCLFEVGNLQEGQVALIHAGSGPVGYFGIQFAKWKGATVISTASGAKADYVREIGADLVIDYKTEDFEEVIKEKYPDGIDFVLDSLYVLGRNRTSNAH